MATADSPVEPPAPRVEPAGLSISALILYTFPLVGVAFIYMLVMVMFLNFATDVLLVAPGVVGTLFLISKIWDAVSDPAAGYLSDRTRSRFGRRRSWILASSLPIALFTLMLWAPPEDLTGFWLNAWVGIGLIGFYSAFTIFTVPHMALAAEMATEPRERNRIFGFRQGGTMVGMLLAFGIGAPLLATGGEGVRPFAEKLAWIASAFTVASILFCTLRLPDERPDYADRGGRNLIKALGDVWGNPHARLLLFVFFIETFGMGAVTAMAPYMVKYVIKDESVLGFVLSFYVVATMLSIPIWVWLGGRFERHKVWIAAMGLSCLGYSALAFQGEGRVGLMIFVSTVTGFAGGCGATLGQAIKADVIDYDEWLTGERKEGSYFAAWNFMAKLATGLMIALSGFALQWSGFQPGVEQTPRTINTILGMMGGMPFMGFLIGMTIFTRFKLTASEHNRIRREIEARSASG